ncbi:putative membrane protein YeaQ/YmgE (transglycosylase-associated protein family) [Agromyces cerinus]|uniref:hypothetical protein n=1 Tax=Agromyces cerinus TaxID=33878 RepID=UPI0019574602|nr:hypothetical protein [Agromyces cerinus]MBM7829368.1 putative membrane protein YeaQ/YmgE (transglycosylase-associated protein family) [Agromyces cerinus]
MDTSTSTRTNITHTPTIRFFRSRRLLGGIGSLALIGLGAAHTITNAGGFVADPDASWPLFLVFGVGVSLVLWVIAVIAWRFSRRGVGRVMRVIVAVVGALLCLMAVNVLRVHPEIVLSPAGPGLWSLIGGPALLAAALLPVRTR